MEETLRFHEWLLKIKNIYLADNERMLKAYAIVYNNGIEYEKKYKRCT